MGFAEWMEKRFARGITKTMIRSYLKWRRAYPADSLKDVLRKTLGSRPGRAARDILNGPYGQAFWEKFDEHKNPLEDLIHMLVLHEYAINQGLETGVHVYAYRTGSATRMSDVIDEVFAGLKNELGK